MNPINPPADLANNPPADQLVPIRNAPPPPMGIGQEGLPPNPPPNPPPRFESIPPNDDPIYEEIPL